MSDDITYDWDDEVANPSESSFVLLPKGTYPFRVVKMERGQQNATQNIIACKKAILTLEIDGGALGKATVRDNFPLTKKMEWKMAGLFTALGFRKSGDPIQVNWFRQSPGKTGWCRVKQRSGENGTTYNDVDSYIAPDKAPKSAPAQAAPQAYVQPPAPAPAPAPTPAPVSDSVNEDDVIPFD